MPPPKKKISDRFSAAFGGNVDELEEFLKSPEAAAKLPTEANPIDAMSPDRGQSMLYIAARFNHVDFVKRLIEAGALINLKNSGSPCSTPLHGACYGGNVEVVKVLVEAGALKTVKNDEGETPLDNAKNPADTVSKAVQRKVVTALENTKPKPAPKATSSSKRARAGPEEDAAEPMAFHSATTNTTTTTTTKPSVVVPVVEELSSFAEYGFTCSEEDVRKAVADGLPRGVPPDAPIGTLLAATTAFSPPWNEPLAPFIKYCPNISRLLYLRDTDPRDLDTSSCFFKKEKPPCGTVMKQASAAWPKLTRVDIDYFGGGLAPVRSTLKEFHISQRMTKEGAEELGTVEGGWPVLEEMELPGHRLVEVFEKLWATPGQFPAVKKVRLFGSLFYTEELAVKFAAAFPALEQLELNGFDMKDDGCNDSVVATVAAFGPRLLDLKLNQMPVPKDKLSKVLKSTPLLKKLYVDKTRGSFPIADVASRSLEELTCGSALFQDSIWKKPKEAAAAKLVLQTLKTLTVGSGVKDAALSNVLAACPKLEILRFVKADGVSSAGVAAAGKLVPHLTSFDATGSKGIDDAAVEAICRSCPNLEDVTLHPWTGAGKRTSPFTDKSLHAIAALQRVTQINIWHADGLTLKGVLPVLKKHGQSLQHLSLAFCNGVAASVVEEITQHCSGNEKLLYLSLRGMKGISQASADAMFQALPNLKAFDAECGSTLQLPSGVSTHLLF